MIWNQYSKSIKTRLITNIILIHAVLMGFVVYDMLEREHSFMQEQLSQKGHDLSSILASNAGAHLLNNDIVALNELISEMGSISDHYMVFILDKNKRVKASTQKRYFNHTLTDEISVKLMDELRNSDTHYVQLSHSDFIDTLRTVNINGNTIGYVRTILDSKRLNNELNIITNKGLAFILLAIIIGALFAWLSVKKMTSNLSRLTTAANKLSKHDFEVELPEVQEEDEVGSMSKAFKVMQNSINTYIQALAKKEQQLNLALEGSSDGLWDWNLQTNQIYFSPRYKEMLGYKDEEFENCLETWSENIHPSDIDKVQHYLDIFLDSPNTSYEQKFRMKTKSGEYIPILARGKKILNDENKAIRLIGTHVDLSELTKVQEELRYQAQHDKLTNLPNRVLFLDRLEQAIKQAKRYNNKVAILFLDLDHFKEINDTLGHDAGDKLLIKVSGILKNTIRDSDTVSRLGGDEFGVIIDKIKDENTIIDIVQKIIKNVNIPHIVHETEFFNTFSIGISVYPQDGGDSTTLLKHADLAMYKAKKSGRNAYSFYTRDMTKKAIKRALLETKLHQAVKTNSFDVHYQPKVNSKTNKIIGFEALVRWRAHKHEGQYSPAEFIPIAEQIGLVTQIDIIVMKKVMQDIKEWKKIIKHVPIVSINLSVVDLNSTNYIEILKSEMLNSQCKSSCIELEVTETQLMNNTEKSIDILNKIRELDIKISIDDFGTGYSSLSYIKKLPISTIKIDKSFVDDISADKSDQEIVKTIISMAKSMNLNIIAEGVETSEQVRILQTLECFDIQGYFYYKPMSSDDVKKLLQKDTIEN